MKKNHLLPLLFLFFVFFMKAQKRPIGTNMTSVSYFSAEIVFADIFKQSGKWVTQNAAGSSDWDTKQDIPVLANGFPTEVPFIGNNGVLQKVAKIISSRKENALPEGTYRLIVKGKGKVRFGSQTFETPVNTLVDFNTTRNLIFSILESQIADPINEVNLILPKYIDTHKNNLFNEDFLSFVKDFQVLRFMDWTDTNHSGVTEWSDRAKDNYHTQGQEAGVSWGNVIRLCNKTKKDAWINVPHRATDQYMRQLARLLKNNLNPNLKIYIEWSNETWNNKFSVGGRYKFGQYTYAMKKGKELTNGLTDSEYVWLYTAKRSADMFHIFKNEFANQDRIINVLASQAGNANVSNKILGYFNDPAWNPNRVKADQLAIAPYFGHRVADQIVNENLVNTITVPQILDRLEQALPIAYERTQKAAEIAKKFNVQLVAYEGGQHLAGNRGNENIQELTDKLTAANRHPKMESLYRKYLDYWYTTVGTLFVNFSSHSSYGKWGSWGVKEYMNDVDNPKYKALKEAVFNHNDTGGDPDQPAYFVIKNRASGRYLRPISTASSKGIKVATLDNSDWFKWEKIPSENGYFYLKNKKSGKFFRPTSMADGAVMEQKPTNHRFHRTQWRLKDIAYDELGYQLLINRWSNGHIRPKYNVENSRVFHAPNSDRSWWTRWSFISATDVTPIRSSKDIFNGLSMVIYPNPTSSFITIKNISGNINSMDYHIVSMNGNPVKTGKINDKALQHKIDIEHLENGIYFLKIGQKTLKFIKQ